MRSLPSDQFCIAILKAIQQRPDCRWNLVGDNGRVGSLAGYLGVSRAGPLSAEERHVANRAFDWLVENDLARRDDNLQGEWIEISNRGRASLSRGSIRSCDVFLTHAAVDNPLALRFKKEVESRISFPGQSVIQCKCFCSSDPTDLPPGRDWPVEVQAALHATRVILLIASPMSLTRPWVWFELGTAWFDEQKTVIPVCCGGLNPGTLPPPIHTKQAVAGHDLSVVLNAVARELAGTVNLNEIAEASRQIVEIDDGLAARRLDAACRTTQTATERPLSEAEANARILRKYIGMHAAVTEKNGLWGGGATVADVNENHIVTLFVPASSSNTRAFAQCVRCDRLQIVEMPKGESAMQIHILERYGQPTPCGEAQRWEDRPFKQ